MRDRWSDRDAVCIDRTQSMDMANRRYRAQAWTTSLASWQASQTFARPGLRTQSVQTQPSKDLSCA
eukprot:8825271-Prorocentrum_lima.AAC.1